MNKTICTALVAASLALLPAQASEVGLLLDKVTNDTLGNYKSSTSGLGIRGAYTVLDLRVTELGVAATFHPRAKGDLDVDYGNGTNKIGRIGNEYLAIGVQLDVKTPVSLHLGLDIRRESLSNEDFGAYDASGVYHLVTPAGNTTVIRPWLKAGIGFSIPLPVASPFLRLEFAYAVKKYSADSTNNGDDFRRAIAPKSQLALYAGVRF